MARSRRPLDTVQVASPCSASWDAMEGDDHVRFCLQCQHHVYNLSALKNADAEALVRHTEGRLCVRFYRRPDGTVMTSDCPVGLRAVRRKLAVAVAVAASLLLALVGWAAGLALAPRQLSRSAGSPSGLRQVEPMHTIMEWIDPTPPPPPIIMGVCLPPQPMGPPPSQEPLPLIAPGD